MTRSNTNIANEETSEEFARDSSAIAAQNDLFRSSLGNTPVLNGTLVTTIGVIARGETFQTKAMHAVAAFSAFDEENDPWAEHDFGAIDIGDQKLFWKIDLYAPDLKHGSEDPADPRKTHRVLTIMLASEY